MRNRIVHKSVALWCGLFWCCVGSVAMAQPALPPGASARPKPVQARPTSAPAKATSRAVVAQPATSRPVAHNKLAPGAAGAKPALVKSVPARPVTHKSAPAVAPAKPASAKPVSAKPVTSHKVAARIDASGTLHLAGKAVSMGQFGALLMNWKRRKVPPVVSLDIAPKAPSIRVMVVKELLKDAGVVWTSASAPALRVSPSPVRPIPQIAPQTAPAGAQFWERVPLAYQRGTKGQKQLLTLRGQVLQADQTPDPSAFVGLVLRRQGQRKAVAVIRCNPQGYFRFRFRAEQGSIFRVSLLQGRKVVEYPIPVERAKDGLLHLRVTLPKTGAAAQPVIRKAPVHAKPPQTVRTKPEVRVPSIHATSSRGQAAKQPCDWARAPKASAKSLPAAGALALQVQLLKLNGQPAGRLPTGIVRVKGSKSKLISRTFSDTNGCLVYHIDRNAPGFYQIFVFANNKVHAHRFAALAKVAKSKATLQVPVWLSPKKAQKIAQTKFVALLMFYESASLDWLKVNFVATVYFMPTPDQPRPPTFILPLPKGAVRLQLDNDLRKLRPEMRKDGLHVRQLKPGNNRLWFSFLLPRDTDAETRIELSFSHAIDRVQAYFEKGKLRMAKEQKLLKTVSLGSKHKTAFLVKTFASAQPDQQLRFTVAADKRPPGGLIGWIARMKRHRKKNKLLGLGLLLGVSCLGLCWIVLVPRRRNPENPSA